MANNVTPYDPTNALYYSNFVQTAYGIYVTYPDNLNPSQEDYDALPSEYSLPDNFTIFLNIQMTDSIGSYNVVEYYGFIAQSTVDPNVFIMTLRGTSNWIEWWDDMHWDLVPFPYAQNSGNVASGFLDIYQTLVVSVPGASEPIMKLEDTPTSLEAIASATSLTVTGHSLGSALTTLYAANLAVTGMNSDVYTFASPRVGDKDFATFYNNSITNNYRVYNWPDVVPDFPKDPFDNYQQVKGGEEYDSLDYPFTIVISVDCFHSLFTYQYLLNPTSTDGLKYVGCLVEI
jgi:hypothetical protein